MATTHEKRAAGIEPPADVIEAVRRMVAEGSEQSVAGVLGVGRNTVSRLRFGMPVRPGTIALVRERLGAR